MPWNYNHCNWFVEVETDLKTSDGKPIKLLEFNYDLNSEITLEWAKHFRNHYCFDTEIDILREGTGFSRKDYLNNLKFPTSSPGFGPGIRAGDFGEILISDYLEFAMNLWIPRTRYGNKTIRDESTKGSDLLGFNIIDTSESIHDVLTMFEVKAQFSGSKAKPRLQDAIDGSIKDELRKAESLNAMKQRFLDKNNNDEAKKVARFQNPEDKPYKEEYGAAALFCNKVYDEEEIIKTTSTQHKKNTSLNLIVLKGNDLMNLVHSLYEIAADEA